MALKKQAPETTAPYSRSSSDGKPARLAVTRLAAPTICTLAGFDPAGRPLVNVLAGPPTPVRSTVRLLPSHVGREVMVAFEQGSRTRPVVLGLLDPHADGAPGASLDVEIDGNRLVFSAEREIVIRCGTASLTLTRDGKVVIRGTNLLSRSSGVNRIKGGSVQIN